MRNEDIYTVIFFRNDTEKLIKGVDEANKYAAEHSEEILFTYTDHSGSEHLERRFSK